MSGLLTLARLDAKLAARHKLVHVTVGVAAVFGALLAFVLPEQLELAGAAITERLGPLTLAGPPPTVLEPGAHRPPLGQQLLAVMYAIDLCLLGYLFGSVMLLQDKEQGTIRAFRVSPGTALDYLGAKLGVNLGLSLLNFVILTGLVAPRALLEPGLLALVVLICTGMTALGMSVAVFLRSIAQWFFPTIAISVIGSLPVYLLLTPSASLGWTWWLPTYHMLFGAESLLFGRAPSVGSDALIYALVFAVGTTSVCALAIHHRLMQELH